MCICHFVGTKISYVRHPGVQRAKGVCSSPALILLALPLGAGHCQVTKPLGAGREAVPTPSPSPLPTCSQTLRRFPSQSSESPGPSQPLLVSLGLPVSSKPLTPILNVLHFSENISFFWPSPDPQKTPDPYKPHPASLSHPRPLKTSSWSPLNNLTRTFPGPLRDLQKTFPQVSEPSEPL